MVDTQPQGKRTPVVLWLAVGLAGCFGLAMTGLLFVRHDDRVLRPGESLVSHDFRCTVKNVTRTKSLGAGASRKTAKGIYLVVTLDIWNHADAGTPFVRDATETKYPVSVEGQSALAATHPNGIASAREIRDEFEGKQTLVFDVPANIRRPHLTISFGLFINMFNRAMLGRQALDLSEGPPEAARKGSR